MGINFDGVNDQLTQVFSMSSTATITMMVWIRPDAVSTNYAGIMESRDFSGSGLVGLFFGNSPFSNRLQFCWSNTEFDDATGLTLVADKWQFCCGRVQSSGNKIYLGQLGATSLSTATKSQSNPARSVSSGDMDYAFDSGFAGRFMDGRLADARLYDRDLSDAEIETIFHAAGRDNIVNSLVYRLPMRDGAPGVTIAADSVIDISGNGYDATPTDGPTWAEDALTFGRHPL